MTDPNFNKEYSGEFNIEKPPSICPSCGRSFDFTTWNYEKIKQHIGKCMPKPQRKDGCMKLEDYSEYDEKDYEPDLEEKGLMEEEFTRHPPRDYELELMYKKGGDKNA